MDFNWRNKKVIMKYKRENVCLEAPFSVNISITEKCPLMCPACFKDFGNVAELTIEEVYTYIDELSQLGTKYIQFSGGDPIMHKSLAKMVAYAKAKGMITRISTSGVGLTEEMIRQLEIAGLDFCHISLNGSTEEIHNLTRSAYQESITALKNLVDSKLVVAINWVANHENIHDLPELIKLAQRYNVKYISVLANKKNSYNKIMYPLTYLDIETLKDYYEEYKDYLEIENCFYELKDLTNTRVGVEKGCRGGRFYMAIDARGHFSACPHIMSSNAKYSTIAEYWNSDIGLLSIRELYKNDALPVCLL